MKEGRSFKAVGGSAGSLHSIGHSRWSTREDTNLGKQDVLFLEVVKEGVEVRTTKVGDGTETSEQTLARQLLEIAFTDVLRKGGVYYNNYVEYYLMVKYLTSIVVRRSNLSKNWVMKMWFSTRPFLSASSASLMISVNHSHCF